MLFRNSHQYDPQTNKHEAKVYNRFPLPRLHGWKVARARVSMELDALNVDIAVVFRAPEFEQDISSRTARCVSDRLIFQCRQVKLTLQGGI
jgi:hypothetical protein